MSSLTIKTKITLWYSAVIVLIMAVLFIATIYISDAVILDNVKDALIETVLENSNAVSYHTNTGSGELKVPYKGVFIIIDDDFKSSYRGVYTALYNEKGELLYGEDFVSVKLEKTEPTTGKIQTVRTAYGTFYVFDSKLKDQGLEGLWVRGTVSDSQKNTPLSSIVKLSVLVVPWIVMLAVGGGYFLAGRMLDPINKISIAAEEISNGGSLSKRIEIGKGNDELHKLADTFNQMLDKLEKMFESEKRFTSDASHELRTPVAVIMAQCEYALDESCDHAEYIEMLQTIQRQGKKLSEIVSDMLNFTRIEQKTIDVSLNELNFSELVNQVCNEMSMIGERGITLKKNIQPDIYLLGNANLLEQLIDNLVSNAYRYGKDNGHIEVKLYNNGEKVILEVADDGIGIAADKLDKVFNRFYRGDASGNKPGTGLGLAIAQEITRLHGGKLYVQSREGQWSKFYFEI